MTRTTTRGAHLFAALLALGSLLVLGACAPGVDGETGSEAGVDAPAGDPAEEPMDESDPAAPEPTGSEPMAPSDDPPSSPLAFSATTLAGDELDLETLSGQPVVLWFWAPWCSICRAEAPALAEVAAELDGQVTFVGVAGRGEVSDMEAFVDETGVEGFEHLVDDDGSIWERFGVVSQPAHAFIAPDGTVDVASGFLRGDDLRARAEALVTG